MLHRVYRNFVQPHKYLRVGSNAFHADICLNNMSV